MPAAHPTVQPPPPLLRRRYVLERRRLGGGGGGGGRGGVLRRGGAAALGRCAWLCSHATAPARLGRRRERCRWTQWKQRAPRRCCGRAGKLGASFWQRSHTAATVLDRCLLLCSSKFEASQPAALALLLRRRFHASLCCWTLGRTQRPAITRPKRPCLQPPLRGRPQPWLRCCRAVQSPTPEAPAAGRRWLLLCAGVSWK